MFRTQRTLPALAVPGLLVAVLAVLAALHMSPPRAQAQAGPTLKALQDERVALARALTPSVVAVARVRPDFGSDRQTGMARGMSQATSGFVVDGEFVVTSIEAGPVSPAAGEFMQAGGTVWMMAHDGTEFAGKVVGTDVRNLLLLVKMDQGHPALPSVRLGDSDKAAIGSTAMSLGNTLDSMLTDRVTSFSFGTVSGFYRFEPLDVLQPHDTTQTGDPYKGNILEVDTAVLPGDHGGPVFNLDGEVIGMINQHYMAGRYLGCTVPSNQIRAVLPQLKKGVPEKELSQGKLGFVANNIHGDSRVFITKVEKGGPAEKAGLKVGQQLTRVDNFLIPGIDRLREMIGTTAIKVKRTVGGRQRREVELHVSYGAPVGTHIQLTVRDADTGKERTVDLVVGEKAEDF